MKTKSYSISDMEQREREIRSKAEETVDNQLLIHKRVGADSSVCMRLFVVCHANVLYTVRIAVNKYGGGLEHACCVDQCGNFGEHMLYIIHSMNVYMYTMYLCMYHRSVSCGQLQSRQ